MLRFWRRIIEFRRRHAVVRRPRYFTGAVNERGVRDISWHGCRLEEPGWNDPAARALAFTLGGVASEADLHVMMNMYWESLAFELPTVSGRTWRRVVDTARPSPDDIADPGREVPVAETTYTVQGRSVVVLALGPPARARRGSTRTHR